MRQSDFLVLCAVNNSCAERISMPCALAASYHTTGCTTQIRCICMWVKACGVLEDCLLQIPFGLPGCKSRSSIQSNFNMNDQTGFAIVFRIKFSAWTADCLNRTARQNLIFLWTSDSVFQVSFHFTKSDSSKPQLNWECRTIFCRFFNRLGPCTVNSSWYQLRLQVSHATASGRHRCLITGWGSWLYTLWVKLI